MFEIQKCYDTNNVKYILKTIHNGMYQKLKKSQQSSL